MAKKNRNQPTTVGFVALGCSKNLVDSERMLAQIAQAGLLITPDVENADVVVINTCGFIAPAKAEAIEAIKHAAASKSAGRTKKIIVTGCLAQREGQNLFEQAKAIDAIIGLAQRDNIAKIIRKTLTATKPAAYLNAPKETALDDRTRLLITPSHWAYLRISEGCNHSCSFCTIPAIRGRFKSKPKDLILAEAAELTAAGVRELNIIAQDTAYYGKDLKLKDALAGLLTELEKIPTLKWIRLMYLYPLGITDKLIETIAASEKILPYFDIPIQHINNDILKAMRRPDTKETITALIEKLKSAIPSAALRTTLIVGFPSETDSQFNELLDFIKWAKFDNLGAFKYYQESGTPAAKMPNQLTDQTKQNRLDQLMLTQQPIAFAKNRDHIGSELLCLIDSIDAESTANARFYAQAPDIDGLCIIKNCSTPPGSFITTEVIDAKGYDLIVKQI